MDNWLEETWLKGTKVEVFSEHQENLGIGVFLDDYIPGQESPQIQLNSGLIIPSKNIWWIPLEISQQVKEAGYQKYRIRVEVKGYQGLLMDVDVMAKDPDEAFDIACSQEPRYQDEDPYLLVVGVGDSQSVFCTYPDLASGLNHIKNLYGGEWFLVERDLQEKGEGTIIKAYCDQDI